MYQFTSPPTVQEGCLVFTPSPAFIVCAFGVIYKKLLPNPLGIYPEETKIEKDTWTPVFIAALFTIARTWKQPRCPSTDEWIKKLWNTMEYYSHKKKCI